MVRPLQLFAALVVGSLLGCADLATAPATAPSPVTPRYNSSEADPPTEWPVKIHSVYSDVTFPYANQAVVASRMRYDAYHASIGGTATRTDTAGNTANFTFSPVARHQFWGFLNQSHQVSFPVSVQHECGTTVQANVNYEAWWQGIGSDGAWRLVTETRSSDPIGYQEPCPRIEEKVEPAGSPNGTSNGGGGNSGCPECVEEPVEGPTWCLIRYKYNIYSGEILSYTVLSCW